jgi:antitoxin component YwqK of YwqJK toxin-antitoxin module
MKIMNGYKLILLALFLLLAVLPVRVERLNAQNLDDDQLFMREYKLPETAKPEAELVVRDSLLLKDGKPFNGTAYLRYDNNQLQQATQYKDGLKQGMMLVWYPNGSPQLMSTYRKGHLNGRFKGWYQFGAVIYDLVLKDDAYSGDQMIENDAARETGSGDDSEPAGDSIEQSSD